MAEKASSLHLLKLKSAKGRYCWVPLEIMMMIKMCCPYYVTLVLKALKYRLCIDFGSLYGSWL